MYGILGLLELLWDIKIFDQIFLKITNLLSVCSSAKEEVWKNAKFPQREYVKTSGKFSSVDYKQIEISICKALQYISVDISHDSIQSLHHIKKSSNRAINNFS